MGASTPVLGYTSPRLCVIDRVWRSRTESRRGGGVSAGRGRVRELTSDYRAKRLGFRQGLITGIMSLWCAEYSARVQQLDGFRTGAFGIAAELACARARASVSTDTGKKTTGWARVKITVATVVYALSSRPPCIEPITCR